MERCSKGEMMDIRTITIVTLMIAIAFMTIPIGPTMDVEALDPDTPSAMSDSSFIGPAMDNQLGFTVSIVGDVDGDGLDDMVIGAPFIPPGMNPGSGVGRAYLFLGNKTGNGNNTFTSQAQTEFIGESAFGWAGSVVAGAGDVNGDGLDDILISAPNAGNGGRVYLILGNRTGLGRFVFLNSVYAYYEGGSAMMILGASLAGGDVNADGFSDIVMGGPGTNSVFIIFGNSSGMKKNITLNNNADAKYTDPTNSQSLGQAVAVGDLDGDAIMDIVMGARLYDARNSNDGAVFVVFGNKSKTWPSGGANVPAAADAMIRGDGSADNFGYYLACGDMDGNSSMELAVGAPGGDHGSDLDTGRVYIFNGTARANWTKGMWAENATYGFWGGGPNDQAPSSLSMGDVNGDGFADLAVGAYMNNSTDGKVYVILGSSPLLYGNRSLEMAHHSFLAEADSDRLGYSVSMNGDINGDAFADILMGAPRHDNGSALDAGKAYVFTRDNNSAPGAGAGKSITIFADPNYTVDAKAVMVGGTIYLEVNATDANSSTVDAVKVRATSSVTDTNGIIVLLKETGANTGIYHGRAEVRDHSFEPYRWIGASEGETITVVTDCTCGFDTVYVGSDPTITPDNTTVNGEAFEDAFYTQKFDFLKAQTVIWTFETNATDWLKWSASNTSLFGLPDNSDVGIFWVNLTIRDILFRSDSLNFTLTVHNVAPKITTSDNMTALEDIPYQVDYNSTDDGQGDITWHLVTNHAWLHINPLTGVLNGTPGDGDIGSATVEVSVDDGHGGMDLHNFTLTVGNVNDQPHINTTDVLFVDEDTPYAVQYTAIDPDPGDLLEWTMTTNASWLMFTAGDELTGTPENDDVGFYWVNVTVEDPFGLSDGHNFTLTVNNTNDPPVITSVPMGVARTSEPYNYDAEATDVDIDAVLSWTLLEAPLGMDVDKDTGNVSWTPTDAQAGTAKVNLSVSDGVANDTQEWTIDVKVRPINVPPVAELLSPANGSIVPWPGPTLQWNGSDEDGDVVKFGLYLSKDEDLVKGLSISALIDNDTVRRTYTPGSALEERATYYWTVVPYDGKVGGPCVSGTWSFTVGAGPMTNHPPVFDAVPQQNVTVGKAMSLSVKGYVHDEDPGDMLSYSLLGTPPAGLSIDPATGLLTWTPSATGTFSVTISVSDNKSSAQGVVVIKVSEDGGGGGGGGGGDGEDDGKMGGTDTLMILALVLLMAIIIVGLSIVAMRHGRKEEKEGEAKGTEEGAEEKKEEKEEEEEEPEDEKEEEEGKEEDGKQEDEEKKEETKDENEPEKEEKAEEAKEGDTEGKD